jgi:hypothetical protein
MSTLPGGDDLARAFCDASVRDWTGRAVRMLAADPDIAAQGLAVAVVLGDVERVRTGLDADPAAATRTDARTGWAALHLACSSRWHRLDPARAEGLTTVAQLLLDAGASPTGAPGNGWTPLRCAVAGTANPAIVRLLLERGAVPDDHDVYLACFGDDVHENLRLLLEAMPGDAIAETTALAAPISTGDTEGVRLLLGAGADPRRPSPAELYGTGQEDWPDWPPVHAAVQSDSPVELVRLLLEAGADPSATGPDGRTPHQLAAQRGRAELAGLIASSGGVASVTDVDLFLSACLATTGAQRCTPRPTTGASMSRGCSSRWGPTCTHATPAGTTTRWAGHSSAAANTPSATRTRTGSRPCKRCSTPAPRSTASRCHRTIPNRPAKKLPHCCALTACRVVNPRGD